MLKKFFLIGLLFFSINIFANNALWGTPSTSPTCYKPNQTSIIAQAPTLPAKILNYALTAYNHLCQSGYDSQGILTVVDYTKPSTDPRLWVIDLKNSKVLEIALVAHGKGSGDNDATIFSNDPGTLASSIGVYLTGTTYYGSHGYALRLQGLEPGVNDNAYKRTIVVHSAWYISEDFAKKYGHLGRSWGCFALSKDVYKSIIANIKGGTVFFVYYSDADWLRSSKFLH